MAMLVAVFVLVFVVMIVVFMLELVVAQLVAQLLLHDLPVLDGEHQVVVGAPEVAADGSLVVGDNCDLHDRVSFARSSYCSG
jgi:hypothetical protein